MELLDLAKIGGPTGVLLVMFLIARSQIREEMAKLKTKHDGFETLVKSNKENMLSEFRVQKEDVTNRLNQIAGQNANQYIKIDKNTDQICDMKSSMHKELVSKTDLPLLVKGIIREKN